MHEYWHVTLEALIHTAQILPLLFIVYYIIELIEYKHAGKMQNSRLLKGKASPVVGAALGCVPQCGFSIVSTDLFSKGTISVGALIAVYIATSDEAIPIMIANPKAIGWMFALIGVKIVVGIVVGYLSILLYKLIFKKKQIVEHNDHEAEHGDVHGGCCHHHVDTKTFDWLHPLLHCLKISLFILLINILFGFVTHIWVGEENLSAFLSNALWLQPLLAVIIGLIPNCASSVVLTELFISGLTSASAGLSFGALVAGLSVNAGLGLIVLLRQNNNWKENLFVFLMLIIPSLIVGYALNFI